jgi:hypothetical protein
MLLADKLLSGASWNVVALDGLVSKLVGAIQSRMPNIAAPGAISISLTNPITGTTGTTPYLVLTDKATGWNAVLTPGTPGGWTVTNTGTTNVSFGSDTQADLKAIFQNLVDQVNATNFSSINNMINQLLTPYNAIKNASTAGVMTRVNNYLNAATQKFLGAFDNRPCWKLTEPTLLFESKEGINRMYPFTAADGSFNINNVTNPNPRYPDGTPSMTLGAGEYTFIMTSMTEEYIVPVYRKYLALVLGGKVYQYHSLPGNEKIARLTIPNEPCEIVYQTCDYYGNVVTKRYPINRK